MTAKEITVTQLRVEYFYDPESLNWGFVVPGLHIVGGADTREEAEREAIDAVAFALRYYGEDRPPAEVDGEPIETEVTYLRVTVQPPEPERPNSKHAIAKQNASD